MINPGEIPQIPGDMDQLTAHAAAVGKFATDFAATGRQVNSTWQGLSGVYHAPEVGQLLAATAPVQAMTASVSEDVRAVGTALTTYAAEVREIQNALRTLRTQAESFVASTKDDEDWREDKGKVAQHNKLRDSVGVQVAAFFEAQRKCANAINSLYAGGVQYRAENGDGKVENGEYGYTAAQLNGAKDVPWGSPEKHDRGFWGDVGAFFGGMWEGVKTFVTDLGSLIGRDPATGEWSWGAAGAAWKGLGTFLLAVGVYAVPGGMALDQFVGLPGLKRGAVGDLLLNAGKTLIAYDQWGEDNSRAAGMATFNIVSAVVGTKGAGAGLRGAGAGLHGLQAGAVGAKVGAGLIRAGEFLNKMPTVGELSLRLAERLNIKIPSLGPMLAIAGDGPMPGHRFDVEMPGGPRHPDVVHMDAGDPNLPHQPPNHPPGSVGDSFTPGDRPSTGGHTRPDVSPAHLDRVTEIANRLGVDDHAQRWLNRTDLPDRMPENALDDLGRLDESGRLAGSPRRIDDIVKDIYENMGGDATHARGAAAELWAARDMLDSGQLAPGSRIALNAVLNERIDLGNGTVVNTGRVPEADLVYQTADGTVHLDEVKHSAQTFASKLAKDPDQLERMLQWRAEAPGREIGVRIHTDEGWTGLFSGPRGRSAIDQLIDNDVPVTIGERVLSPAQLDTLRSAVERAAMDADHGMPPGRGQAGPWFEKYMPNLAAAKEFLGPYGVDFL